MGWGRTLLLGDIGPCSRASQARITTGRRNRMDIEDTERDIHGLRRQLTSAKTNVIRSRLLPFFTDSNWHQTT